MASCRLCVLSIAFFAVPHCDTQGGGGGHYESLRLGWSLGGLRHLRPEIQEEQTMSNQAGPIIETKFTFNGLPVLVTGGSFPTVNHIDRPLAVQARITYENGDTGYVDFSRLDITRESYRFRVINTNQP
jgi:hypothetical protein